MSLISDVEDILECLKYRGYGERDRLFRKLVEETGEYAEAIEYNNGASRKIKKYEGRMSSEEKLKEEVCDIVMVSLALAKVEGLSIHSVLKEIRSKLSKIEDAYQKSLNEKM